ncbi:MAG TPA: hypothetical protein VJ019_09315 [Aestuariivirga sp.]|jgi:hypothetical protein|nr:hypothetical protein [Aestuariivirga sp.]
MSVVLQFPYNRVSSRDPFDMVHSAEVVIFPGVRVERRNFDKAKPPVSGSKRRVSQAAIDEDMA